MVVLIADKVAPHVVEVPALRVVAERVAFLFCGEACGFVAAAVLF